MHAWRQHAVRKNQVHENASGVGPGFAVGPGLGFGSGTGFTIPMLGGVACMETSVTAALFEAVAWVNTAVLPSVIVSSNPRLTENMSVFQFIVFSHF